MFKIIGIGAAAVLTILLAIVAVNYISYHNYGVATERRIEAKLVDNRQLLARHGTQIGEMAQVNAMYRDDLIEIYTAAIESRYGEDGINTVMTWIKEQNPDVSPELYVRLSQRIEANRNEFYNAQTQLIDMKRAYETELDSLWSGFWLRTIHGYPEMDLDSITIISSTRANSVYDEGVDDGITIRN